MEEVGLYLKDSVSVVQRDKKVLMISVHQTKKSKTLVLVSLISVIYIYNVSGRKNLFAWAVNF